MAHPTRSLTHGSFHDVINFINLNQDFTCISVGTKNGYNLFNCEPFGKCFAKVDGGIGIVEMLFCTSLVAVVGVGDQPHLSPRRLKIVNTKRRTNICELTFPTAVLKVKLNRKRLIVLLEEQIYIYDISNMELLYTIETSPNPQAICALSPSSDNCYLAYPSPAPQSSSPFAFPTHNQSSSSSSAFTSSTSPNRTGDVVVFDTISLQPVNVIEAHKSPLSVVSFNNDGTLLATASDKGTIVRVFSVPTATKLFQFRRGTYPARIFSINFNLTSTLMAVSSATETVHIFRLARPGNIQAGGQQPTVFSESVYESNVAKGKIVPKVSASGGNGNGDQGQSTSITEEGQDTENGGSSAVQADDSSPGTGLDNENVDFSAAAILPHMTDRESSVAELDAVANSKAKQSSFGFGSGGSNGSNTSTGTDTTSSAPKKRGSLTSSVPGSGVMASMFRRGSRTLGKHVAGAMGTYLPTAVTEMWEPQRDFAFVRLSSGGAKASRNGGNSGNNNRNGGSRSGSLSGSSGGSVGPGGGTAGGSSSATGGTTGIAGNGTKTVVAFNADSTRLFLVTGEGYFYQYGIDLARGGECVLLQQYSLFDNSD